MGWGPLGCPVALLRRVTLRHAEPLSEACLIGYARWEVFSKTTTTTSLRFRNYTAPRILMTNAIGVAKTIIANRPIASDAPQAPSHDTLGFVPLAFLWLLKARGFVMCVFGSSVVKFLPGPHFNHYPGPRGPLKRCSSWAYRKAH